MLRASRYSSLLPLASLLGGHARSNNTPTQKKARSNHAPTEINRRRIPKGFRASRRCCVYICVTAFLLLASRFSSLLLRVSFLCGQASGSNSDIQQKAGGQLRTSGFGPDMTTRRLTRSSIVYRLARLRKRLTNSENKTRVLDATIVDKRRRFRRDQNRQRKARLRIQGVIPLLSSRMRRGIFTFSFPLLVSAAPRL